ncbi:hypothetical protein MNBD_NITROSPINAE03-2035 [hydrothermal vent metagenome]|uniref:Uncharacterized protein n=1 Tax=hydrothermal vent metagenome TaxID=652676 RepID=A0A3B1CZR6_9ZZZZ
MGKNLALKLLPFIVAQLIKALTPDLMKRFADKILDAVEDAIQKSENKFDDAILPLLTLIRSAFNVPDNDAG